MNENNISIGKTLGNINGPAWVYVRGKILIGVYHVSVNYDDPLINLSTQTLRPIIAKMCFLVHPFTAIISKRIYYKYSILIELTGIYDKDVLLVNIS